MDLFQWGKLVAEKKHTVGIALEKGLGSDRMNGTCGVEMSELFKPCGAEEYAINDSRMKCRFRDE